MRHRALRYIRSTALFKCAVCIASINQRHAIYSYRVSVHFYLHQVSCTDVRIRLKKILKKWFCTIRKGVGTKLVIDVTNCWKIRRNYMEEFDFFIYLILFHDKSFNLLDGYQRITYL